MSFEGQAVGAQRIDSRIDSPIRQKFSVLLFADWTFNIVSLIKKTNDLKADATKSLKILAGDKANKKGDDRFQE